MYMRILKWGKVLELGKGTVEMNKTLHRQKDKNGNKLRIK